MNLLVVRDTASHLFGNVEIHDVNKCTYTVIYTVSSSDVSYVTNESNVEMWSEYAFKNLTCIMWRVIIID